MISALNSVIHFKLATTCLFLVSSAAAIQPITDTQHTAGIDHGSRPKERSKTGGSLRNVIDHRELPVAEKEAREFTAVTSSTQSQLSIVDKARIDSLPSVSHKAVAIFPSVATKRKLTNAITIKQNNTSIRTAVSAWCDDEASATTTYGHISTWDTSEVTDMSYLFGATYDDNYNNYVGNGMYCSSISTFNSDISTWNVSSVTTMYYMFFGASSFNQPLSTWDVSSVTNMYAMFREATAFNQPLSTWDVSSVVSWGMDYMFFDASAFDQTICGWDLSGLSLDAMFEGSLGSVADCAPTAAPTAAKASDDGPDDGTLQEIGDAVVDYWSATKNLFKVIWGAVF